MNPAEDTPFFNHHLTAHAEDAARLLASLRPRHAHPVPPALLIRSPLLPTDWSPLAHRFDRAVFEAAAQIPNLQGRVLAFDLDDTLLNTSYASGDHWVQNDPEGGYAGAFSLDYKSLQHPLSFWLKAGWRRPLREQYSSERYPFLKNPEVVAQLRPGSLALLHGLRKAGATLALVTLCARERVDFLFQRIPPLASAFAPASESGCPPDSMTDVSGLAPSVMAAEDLAAVSLFLQTPEAAKLAAAWPEATATSAFAADFAAGFAFHEKAPRHFSIKTVVGLHIARQLSRLDLLIDDSAEGEAAYREMGLAARYLLVEKHDPHGPQIIHTLAAIAARFDHIIEPAPKLLSPTALEDYPLIRFEDPLYFPLIHHVSEFQSPKG